MTETELLRVVEVHVTGWPGDQASRDVSALVAEVRRLRSALEDQRRVSLELAERLAACSQVLGRAAERGKVCQCQHGATT